MKSMKVWKDKKDKENMKDFFIWIKENGNCRNREHMR